MGRADRIADYFFEVGHLARTPRTGFAQLGERADHQSVAEHSHRMAVIGMALAWSTPGADAGRVAQLCLVHDLPESRTLDLHHLAQRYVSVDERAAVDDLVAGLAFGDRVAGLIDEYEARETLEAQLAREADVLELICALKELIDRGNLGARAWMERSIERLDTDRGRAMARAIGATPSDRWWRAVVGPGAGPDAGEGA